MIINNFDNISIFNVTSWNENNFRNFEYSNYSSFTACGVKIVNKPSKINR